MILAIVAFAYVIAVLLVVRILKGLHQCDELMTKMVSTIERRDVQPEPLSERENEVVVLSVLDAKRTSVS